MPLSKLMIQKRNGEMQLFESVKILNAVRRAKDETSNETKDLSESVVIVVREQLPIMGELITVEDIQDLVEIALMKKAPEVAKAYILYRNKRKESREQGWNFNELQQAIWDNKYKFADKDLGINETFNDWKERVSGGNNKLKAMIQKRQFLFGGRILANRGLNAYGRKVTYSNCYVLPRPEDNLESIFDTNRDMARTYSYGGGVGISIKKLRPADFKVHNNARTTSGAVSFMPIFSLTTETIGQHGRRGALMISIPSSHPDLEKFIDIKTDLAAVRGANISIEVEDLFMQSVKEGGKYRLHFECEDTGEVFEKWVNAKALYNKIIKNNLDYAEPGMLFWDTICDNHFMSADDRFEYEGTNPCAEEPLPGGGSCLLGSINLAEFVDNPFTAYATFNFSEYRTAIETSVEALNEVLDEGLPFHPLAIQRKVVEELRQIGLGVMGIADMLIKMGIVYGSEEALELNSQLSHALLRYATIASSNYAAEHGSFEWYDWENISRSKFFIDRLDEDVKQLVKKQGMRNSQLLCIAPTGSISTMLGISGGIEPTFAFSFTRTTKSLHKGEDVNYEVYADIVEEYRKVTGDKGKLPEYFIASHDLHWKQRIDMQAVWQENIDASISSTLNLPESVGEEEAMDLYTYAWEKGLKGATIFREGGKLGGILVTKKEEVEVKDEVEEVLEPVTGFFDVCPECKSTNMVHAAGCVTCQDCGFSPCS